MSFEPFHLIFFLIWGFFLYKALFRRRKRPPVNMPPDIPHEGKSVPPSAADTDGEYDYQALRKKILTTWGKQEEGKELFILEAALLTEPVYREMLDEIWYIHVPQEIRMERLRSSRGYSDEKMYAVFANQPSEETFTAVSDLVIENGGTFEETEKQIDLALGRG